MSDIFLPHLHWRSAAGVTLVLSLLVFLYKATPDDTTHTHTTVATAVHSPKGVPHTAAPHTRLTQAPSTEAPHPIVTDTIPLPPHLIAQQASAPSIAIHSGYTSICAPEAIAVGIWHHPYTEPNPAELVSIGGRYKLHHEAAVALQKLTAAARRAGVTLTVGSAFRSVECQRGIVQRKQKKGQHAHQIYHLSSPPGYSEHHTGFAVDFAPINHSFERTAAYRWLRQHAAQYGWEQSFTHTSTAPDGLYRGISPESWHWKYTGSTTARAALAAQPCTTY